MFITTLYKMSLAFSCSSKFIKHTSVVFHQSLGAYTLRYQNVNLPVNSYENVFFDTMHLYCTVVGLFINCCCFVLSLQCAQSSDMQHV